MKFQYPIAWLLAAIGFCGIAFAALRSPVGWWASIVFTATLIGLAFSALYAVHRRGPRQAFWSAFVAFGAGYMVLVFGPGCETSIRPRLMTTKLLDALFPIVHPGPEAGVRLWDAATGRPIQVPSFAPDGQAVPGGIGMNPASAPAREPFQDIGHSLTALLLAGIGGMAARSFYGHRDERRREAVEKVASVMLKVIEAGL